jgi:cytochrome bd-type quinol oxidase subunit 1
VPAAAVASSLTLFIIVYMVLFAAHLHYSLKIIRKGPDAVEVPTAPEAPPLVLAGRS